MGCPSRTLSSQSAQAEGDVDEAAVMACGAKGAAAAGAKGAAAARRPGDLGGCGNGAPIAPMLKGTSMPRPRPRPIGAPGGASSFSCEAASCPCCPNGWRLPMVAGIQGAGMVQSGSPRTTVSRSIVFCRHSSSILSASDWPFTATILSPRITTLPAPRPPTHCLFQASMAPPGTMPVTCSAWSGGSPCSMSTPRSTPSARRSMKPKTQPPPSQITNGEAGTGDFIGVELPMADREVRFGVSSRFWLRSGVPGTRGPGVPERDAAPADARCGVAAGRGSEGDIAAKMSWLCFGPGLRRPGVRSSS
mmetsp:Transcript_72746/g.187692  ORF Transcript_72746/g.187692 Transcript_72746/m.187692 type:complete len:305 (+) Transcript_72746:46-960(+)